VRLSKNGERNQLEDSAAPSKMKQIPPLGVCWCSRRNRKKRQQQKIES
jgi:hypothetical protein